MPEETTVYRQGETPTAFYVVHSGEIVLIRDTIGKPVQLLQRIEEGSFFGASQLLDGAPREETARTVEPTELLIADRGALLEFVEEQPLVRLQFRRAAIAQASANIDAALELSTRKEVRIRVDREVLLTLVGGRSHTAHLENLSLGGASLSAAPEGWQPRTSVHFHLGTADKPHLLELEGTVAWRKGDRVGIAFADSLASKARISSALQELLPRRGSAPEPPAQGSP